MIQTIYSIYSIGVFLCVLWFFLVAVITFEKMVYDTTSSEGKKSIESMQEVLRNIYPDNPQLAYIIISLLITITWPISIPYILIKINFK